MQKKTNNRKLFQKGNLFLHNIITLINTFVKRKILLFPGIVGALFIEPKSPMN